ncbi:MAG: S8 family serine peptidase, partial [Pseudomonadota bacterium]
YYSGTSFAAPFVSAAMALLRARDPEAGLKSVLSLLADSAIDLGAKGRDPLFGHGLLQMEGDCVTTDHRITSG